MPTAKSSKSRVRSGAFIGVVLALLVAGCSALPLRIRSAAALPVEDDVQYFENRGHPIRVDVYKPESRGRHPAVILLHGSFGVHSVATVPVTRYAQALAEVGIVSLVVHYFDATGDVIAGDSAERDHYFRWVDVVHDAVTWAGRRPDVNPKKVGLLGYSLGAWLAVGAAAMDPRIDRVVLFGSGLEPFLEDKITRMPATLIFHGDQDDVVPLSDARHLADFLHAHHCKVKLRVYRGEGHTFADSAATDALARAGRFFGSKAVRAKR